MVDRETVEERLDMIVNSESMKSAIKGFIEYHGWKSAGYNKWDVRDYLSHLEEEGKSKNYARFSFYSIKNLFEAMDLGWDLNPRKDLPKKPSSLETDTPVMSRDQVERMVSAVKTRGRDYEKFYTCLSTCYGMRRKEMCLMEKDDVRDESIFVRTAKGGEQRRQWMPPEVRPTLKAYDFDRKITPGVIRHVFDDIIDKAGIVKERRMNWHSIRRSLRTELGRELRKARKEGGVGLIESDIYSFLRWKSRSGEQEMLSIYDHASPIEGDKEVMEIHPFLKFWS